MLVYQVYNHTRNEKKARITKNVCEQLEDLLIKGKFRTFAFAVEKYAESTKRWNISYEGDIPIEGYFYLNFEGITHHVVFEGKNL